MYFSSGSDRFILGNSMHIWNKNFIEQFKNNADVPLKCHVLCGAWSLTESGADSPYSPWEVRRTAKLSFIVDLLSCSRIYR